MEKIIINGCLLEADGSVNAKDLANGMHKQDYYSFPNGVEAQDICRYLDFNLGNVVKYVCRAGRKPGAGRETDLRKALDYLRDEIALCGIGETAEP